MPVFGRQVNRSELKPVLIIVVAQLFGTSLWFSANGVSLALAETWNLSSEGVGYLTSSVQAGFIAGTLTLALTGLADRYPASRIFLISSLFGAVLNASLVMAGAFPYAVLSRFLTGFALAGIYPLGMKLIVSWAPKRSGFALGLLVGMLTLGTALPHLVRGIGAELPWQVVIYCSSALALIGGGLVAFLGDGPLVPPSRRSARIQALVAFKSPAFRASAFGYFGHMWELYAFWTITPLLAAQLLSSDARPSESDVAYLAFFIIGIGSVGCVAGGWLSRKLGSAKVALFSLATSGVVCLIYPLVAAVPALATGLLLLWGLAVVADSPQFSALSAQAAPQEGVGGALTIQNAIGFLITIPSITLVTWAWPEIGAYSTWLLAPGPILGVVTLARSPLLAR